MPSNPFAAVYEMLLQSTQELGNGGDYRLLLVFAQLGEDGQGQDFAIGALGLGEAAIFIAEAVEVRGFPSLRQKKSPGWARIWFGCAENRHGKQN